MATLYVNHATGDDSRTYAQAQNSATPWDTIGRAAWGSTNRAAPSSTAAAQAGDTVMIAAGTYIAVEIDDQVAWEPTNEGTAGNPITFEGVGDVYIATDSNLTPPSGGWAMGAHDNKSYITFKNLIFDDVTNPAFGGDGLVHLQSADNIVIDGCRFYGRGGEVVSGNNYAGIFNTSTTDWTVKNCYFEGFGNYNIGAEENHTGIETYNICPRGVIEHCEFYHCATGVYHKAPTDLDGPTYDIGGSVTIRYSLFRECKYGVIQHRAPATSTNPFLVYQNIIRNMAQYGVQVRTFDLGNTDPKHGYYINNTFINNGPGGGGAAGNIVINNIAANSGIEIYNNIFYQGDYAIYYEGSNYSADRIAFDRNLGNGLNQNYGHLNVTDYNLTDWKTATAEDDNSVSTAPSFVNITTHDYHLVDNAQTALTLGRVVHSIGGTNGATIPIGAYITGSETIGRESAGETPAQAARYRFRRFRMRA